MSEILSFCKGLWDSANMANEQDEAEMLRDFLYEEEPVTDWILDLRAKIREMESVQRLLDGIMINPGNAEGIDPFWRADTYKGVHSHYGNPS